MSLFTAFSSPFFKRTLVLASAGLLLTVTSCKVQQEEAGELPEVDVETEAGELPELDVDTAEVDVSTEEKTVTTPEVEVTTEERTVETPDIDVSIPDDEAQGE
ncbi:MAG: hypothetical protein ACFB4J_15095 [Elainellaceae cyanobacterium]